MTRTRPHLESHACSIAHTPYPDSLSGHDRRCGTRHAKTNGCAMRWRTGSYGSLSTTTRRYVVRQARARHARTTRQSSAPWHRHLAPGGHHRHHRVPGELEPRRYRVVPQPQTQTGVFPTVDYRRRGIPPGESRRRLSQTDEHILHIRIPKSA